MMRFIMSSSAERLGRYLEGKKSVTVEAEYGDTVVEGSVLTMAHHGARAGQPAPCSYPNGCAPGAEIVGLSHLDLDSLGGCAAILGEKVENQSFWRFAEFIDLSGPHKARTAPDFSEENLRMYHSFLDWNEKNRVMPPGDGGVIDVTITVCHGICYLESLLCGSDVLIKCGDDFAARQHKLNEESFVEVDASGKIILRVSPVGVNHLYETPDGQVAEAVIRFNPVNGAITLSLADPHPTVNLCDVVRNLWGPAAGGHATIAGSPRGERMPFTSLFQAWERMLEILTLPPWTD